LLGTLSTAEPVGIKIVIQKEGKLTFRVDEYCTFYSAVLNHQWSLREKHTHFAHNQYEGAESHLTPSSISHKRLSSKLQAGATNEKKVLSRHHFEFRQIRQWRGREIRFLGNWLLNLAIKLECI
jgi:hypothetical protein